MYRFKLDLQYWIYICDQFLLWIIGLGYDIYIGWIYPGFALYLFVYFFNISFHYWTYYWIYYWMWINWILLLVFVDVVLNIFGYFVLSFWTVVSGFHNAPGKLCFWIAIYIFEPCYHYQLESFLYSFVFFNDKLQLYSIHLC